MWLVFLFNHIYKVLLQPPAFLSTLVCLLNSCIFVMEFLWLGQEFLNMGSAGFAVLLFIACDS